ncbi:MAG: glucosaminidase domain-containing protein [Clostridia bacterium]|nr:glucosaminidase domain-containing protein [Clostridia bacterium]
MKYTASNKPLVCMQTNSTCYKGTNKMTVKGVLWHSTGANNPTLKRYVQPSDTPDKRDTVTLAQIGKNAYKNDWNHIERQAGLNCWIGKLADGTVTTIQTMPWDYRPWGCGSGSKGSCNSGWIQFEICEDGLTDKTYFNAVYKEACEITAYLCKMFNIDPNGTVNVNGVKVPTILCHQDSYKLGMGSNHSDVNHWFPKHGKSMATARKDVAALLAADKSATSTPVSTTGKTYSVVTKINKYATASDAQSKKNSKGTYEAGTYYIYSKYPNGYNGMYNISTDKTGASAGSWINPAENVVPKPATPTTDTTQKLYRVRKSKDDAKSQVGAYSVLDNAKDACNKAGAGYKVFDWNYKVVYEYTAPVETKPETKPTQPTQPTPEVEKPKEEVKVVAVYDLDFPEKNLIVDKSISRTETDCVKAIKKIVSNNSGFDVEIAKAFWKLAPKYNIDPVMAISQSILETGWFKYAGSAVTPEQHNYCGLGVTSNGVEGGKFNTIEDGVTAQLQHLFAYGSKDALNETIVDPRFKYVTRGIAPYWQQLAGRWACPGYDTKTYDTPAKAMAANNTYGQKIRAIYNQIVGMAVTDADIEKYFPTELPQETPDKEPVVTPPTDIVDTPEKTQDTSKIVNIIIEVIKKLLESLIEIFRKGTK